LKPKNPAVLNKLSLIAKRFFWLMILLIYLGGACHDFVVRSTHEIYHLITHTLHQHAHSHTHSHTHSHDSHGHSHNHFVDEVLNILDQNTENANTPATPASTVQIKFADHLIKTNKVAGLVSCDYQKTTHPYVFVIIENRGEPQTPPPKVS
jgi:hypothetical protein